ncbi:MAG: hypothetical protein EU551_04165, partial [Promethearchaeota archaeon]
MLHSIIILKKDSGVCMFSEKYTLDFDSSLFSGFLTAVQNFAENLQIGRLTSFITQDKIIVLSSSEYVVVSLIIDLEDNADDWMVKAFKIAENFESKYDMDRWAGDISIFKKFSDDIKEMLGKEEEDLLLRVAKWAKKEFGGELQLNAVIKPRKNEAKLKVDVLLDRGDIEPDKLDGKVLLRKHPSLGKDYCFIKVVDGIVGRGDIKDFIERIVEFGDDKINEDEGDEIFPYFPNMIAIIGRDFSSTVKDLTDNLYKSKNKKHLVVSKN